MFTLNRVTMIGFGAGLVLVGCASPIGDAPDDPTAASTAALTEEEEAVQAAETNDEAMAALSSEIASAFEMPESAPSDDAMSHDAKDEKSDKWFGYGRFGWGGGGSPGLYGGLYGFGSPGYAYGYAAPFGYGYARTIGYGSACGLYGCAVW